MSSKSLLIVGLVLFGLAALTLAATPPPPRTISYQGRLTDSGGSPVADGSYNLNFVIWNDPTSTSLANKVWESGSVAITTASGLFNVDLGAPGQAVLPDSIFVQDTNLYLGISVNGGAEMTPRSKLASVAYAYEAGTVPDNSLYSSKIIDEAGLTYTSISGSVYLDTSLSYMTDIITISINAPGYGFIVVNAGGQLTLLATAGNPNLMAFQIDQTAGGSEDPYDYQLAGFGETPNPQYYFSSFSITKEYFVPYGGQYTFRLEARNRYPANNYFWSPRISATYYPTYYGILAKSGGTPMPIDTAYVDGQVPFRQTQPVTQPAFEHLKK